MAVDLSKFKKHEKYREDFGSGVRDVIPAPVVKKEKKEIMLAPVMNSNQVAKNILDGNQQVLIPTKEDIQKMTSQKMNDSGYRQNGEKNTKQTMIAPIMNQENKKTVTPYQENKEVVKDNLNKKWYERILQGSEIYDDNLRHFKDGYQFGDVTKTGLEYIGDTVATGVGTVADLGLGFAKGVAGIGEGTGKAISGAVAQVADWTGHDEYANKVRNRLAGREDGAFDQKYLPTEMIRSAQNKVDKASIAGEYADKASESIGYMGGLMVLESMAPGVDTATMFLNSTGHTLAEAYARDENVEDWQAWTKAIGNGAFETLIEKSSGLLGGKGMGEKIAERISKQISSGAGKVLSKMVGTATDEALEEFKSYCANWGLDRCIDAVSKATGSDVKFSEDWNWSEVGEAMALAFATSSIMGGVQANNIQSQEPQNMKPQATEMQNNKLLQNNRQITQADNKVAKNGNTEQINENKRNYLNSAQKYNIDINNKTVTSIYEIAERRGIQTTFDDTVFSNTSQNAIWKINEDGTRQVILNAKADTKQTLQSVMIHELTHDFEGSKEYNALHEMVLEKMQTQEGFNEALKSLKETYSQVYDPNSKEFNQLVEQEAVADFLGENLGNQEFINELIQKQDRNTVQKIYDWVVDKVKQFKNKITGNEEALYWQKVKNAFEKSFNEMYQRNNMVENVKYHISKNLSNDIDNVLRGNYNASEDVKLRDFTPKILVDTGIRDLPMLMNQSHLKDNILSATKARKLGIFNKDANYHNLGKETFIKAIDSLDNPIMVMKSISKNNNKNTYVIVTDVQNQNGEQIIVPIYLEGKGNYNSIRIDTNKVKTIYGKSNIKDLVDNTIKNDINNIIYMTNDKNKKQLITSIGLQLSNSSKTASNKSIAPIGKDVNRSTKYSMQKNQNNTITDTAWKEFLTKNSVNKGKGETIQEVKLAPIGENVKRNKKNAENPNITQEKETISNLTRHDVIQNYRNIAKENIKNIATWNDKSSGLKYQLETMERNMYDIIPDKKEAKKMIDTYFEPIHTMEAEKQRFINRYNNRIKAFDLNKYESEAVQVLGEKKYNLELDDSVDKNGKTALDRVDENIKDGKVDEQKVKKAIEEFRKIYDELFEIENSTLKEYGYKEKPYRKGYFPHFIDSIPETKTEKILNKLGFKIDKRPLPTNIAGITEQFVPGKTWNKSALERKTTKTDYNALKGFDTYIAQAADNIFHTENIQRLRGLENEIRYQYSDKGIQEEIDRIMNDEILSQDEKQDLIDKKFEEIENPLPNLVTELHRYTNALANKKSEADRSIENMVGRSIYSTATAIENRFGANAVGLNIGSAVTNFISITQAYSQVSTKNMGRTMLDTVKSYMLDDGFVDKSTFLTNRLRQSEKLYQTTLDKVSNATSFLFNAIDDVSSNIIVRGKYLDNLKNGMNESEAMKNADRFAANVMADRSKGALPTKFEEKNPATKMLTQFQLEVNNQFRYMFKDIPRDLAEKGLGAIALAYFKMFLTAWLYNKASKETTGRDSAFSPIDLAVSGYQNITDENQTTYNKIASIATDIGEQLPFIGGLIGGGRVPVNGAIPNMANLTEAGIGLATGEMNSKKAVDTIKKEVTKPLYYLLPPLGGGQLKKSAEGLKAVANGGSYGIDKNGEKTLQFPVEKNIGNAIKAVAFGKYSMPIASKYVDSGFKSLNAETTKLYDETGIDYNILTDYIDYSGEATVKDSNGYSQYTDKNNNMYWYDKEKQTLYSFDYKKSSKNIKDLEKSSKKEMLVEYVNNLNINDKEKMALYKYNIISSTVSDDGTSGLSDMEHMLKNGMTEKEYMNSYTKAINNKINFPDAKEYDKIKNAGLKVDTYLDYKINVKEKTSEKRKSTKKEDIDLNDVEKMKILQSSNYSTKEREALYCNYIMSKSDDDKETTYEKLKSYYKSENIIDQYLDYNVKANEKLEELKKSGKKKEGQSLSDRECTQLLVDSKYSKEQTEALYVNVVASESNKNKYEILKSMNKGNSIDPYLKFMLSDRESDKEDDGTKSGKSIDGTKKKKIFNTIESLNISKIAKIYLYGTEYNLNTNTERHNYQSMMNYLGGLSKKEQLKIVKTLKGAVEMKNGSYNW